MDSNGTWLDLTRSVVGDLSDDDCHDLLWNASCYPFGSPEQVEKSLRESWENGGRTVDGAISYAHAELDGAMDEHRSQRA